MPQSAADLPFLVVYGAYVWVAGMAALLAAVYGLCRLSRRRAARAEAEAAARRVASAGDGDGGIVVLEGTLASTGAPAAAELPAGALAATLRADAIELNQRTVSHWQTGELWLHTADKRVRLEGEILVEAGGRAAAARNGVPALVSDAHLEAARAEAPWLHRDRSFGVSEVRTASVAVARPGDRVVARGRLESGPSGEPSSYREAELAWVLRPAADGAPIQLAARSPAPAVLRMDRGLLSIILGFTALAAWIAMGVLDDRWAARCKVSAEAAPDAPLELTNTHACALAAALPGTRRAAIERLSELLAEHPYRDEGAVRRLVAAHELHSGCRDTPALLLQHALPEAALEAARECRDLRGQHTALVALGRFDEAARLQEANRAGSVASRLPETTVLIAAGQWSEAALHADEIARMKTAGEAPPTSVRYHRCLAELLRAFGGSAEAAARLRGLDAEEPGRCAAMIAELAPAERRTVLAERGGSAVGDLLRWTMGLEPSTLESGQAEALLADPRRRDARDVYLPWFVALEAATWKDLGPWHRSQLLRWRAAGEVLAGRPEAALATAREAAASYEVSQRGEPERTSPSRIVEHLRYLPAAIELYTPGTAAARALRLDEAIRTDPEVEHAMYLQLARLAYRGADGVSSRSWHGESYASSLRQAQRGDGRPLAQVMSRRYASWDEADVMAVLPRVREGREALARALAWHTPFSYESASVGDIALHAVVRRDALKLAGLPAEAARWDAVYRRCDAVLRDRRKLVALMLWAE